MSFASRVIVGACSTPGSIRALRYARDLAAHLDVTLMPVHAWLPPGGDVADRRAPNPALRRIWKQAALQRLHDSMEAAWGGIPASLDVQPLVARGMPGEILVDVAGRPDDLIIVGAGRRGLARLFHGRVVRYCLAHAQCPVVAVPPSALARYAGHGPLSYAFRHHGMTVGWAFDDADRSGG